MYYHVFKSDLKAIEMDRKEDHDVYLCALLEYLMNYAEGQLCFTTHNVGPMDIFKHYKKSIDFIGILN